MWGAAARTSASTWASKRLKFSLNMSTRRFAVAELGLIGPGLDRVEDVRLDAGHRGRHREAEIRVAAEIGAGERAVEGRRQQAARDADRHAAADAVLAALQPVLTSQQSRCLAMRSRSRLPYTDG